MGLDRTTNTRHEWNNTKKSSIVIKVEAYILVAAVPSIPSCLLGLSSFRIKHRTGPASD